MLRSLMERYSLSGAAFQAPDAPAPAPSDPPAPPPAPEPPALAADAPAEPPAPAPNAAPTWALERISEATAARRAAETEAANWRELAERLQAAPAAPAPDAPAPPPAPRTAAPSYEADVARGVAAQKLMDDSIDVLNAGNTEFKDSFANTRNIVEAVGFLDNAVLGDLFAVDKSNAHKIMTELAKDPERAAQIARMDSRRRTAEFTRISMTIATPKPAAAPAPASAAPAPRPALAPVAAPPENDGLSDEVSDEEFSRNWDAQNLKRTG